MLWPFLSRFPPLLSPLLLAAACSATDSHAPPLGSTGGSGDPPDSAFDAIADAASEAEDSFALDAADEGDADATAPSDAADAFAPTSLRVLFVGNSYVYVNDLPGWVRRIAATSGQAPAIETSSVAVGGATLEDHWTGTEAQAAIAQGAFTHVVLQGQSVEPLLAPESFQTYAGLLAQAVTDANAEPAFFETWARAAGDAVYAEPWSGGSPHAMQDGLLTAYSTAATDHGALLAKVGEAWRATLVGAPQVILHQSDGSHPTEAGTWLAACVFYGRLTGQEVPPSSERPPSMTTEDAALLRAMAAANTQ